MVAVCFITFYILFIYCFIYFLLNDFIDFIQYYLHKYRLFSNIGYNNNLSKQFYNNWENKYICWEKIYMCKSYEI